MADLLSEALEYAKRGWHVFPCREKPGVPYEKNGSTVIPQEKTPYTSNGLYDATTDADQINAWWSVWENAMIGVNAGKSGLFVIDIDKKHVNGLETFEQWDINDSAGLHSITPSGGMHIVFKGSGKTSTNAGKTEPDQQTGIDTRGEGGYFIAPPSRILNGTYSGEYKKFDDWSREPGIIPDGLMGKLFPDNTYEYVRGNNTLPNGEKGEFTRETLNFFIRGAKVGERNSTLFKVLAEFAGNNYTVEEAREAVLPVSRRIGLDDGEFEKVLEHAYSKERTPSIPLSIQEKLKSGNSSQITFKEQSVMEDALLACMIIDNQVIAVIQDILNYDDFQVFKNRIIYRVIVRLYNAGNAVDFITVNNEVEKETDKVSLDDISKLINNYLVDLSPDNVITYASIIREKASLRRLESVMDNKSKYFKAGTLSNVIANIEKDITEIALYGGVKSTNILDSRQATDMVVERTKKIVAGEIEQLKTGFIDYDYHVGGLYSNEMVVCAARSGEGKSALALSIANHVAIVDKKPVAFFSLEMSTHESICRLISQLTGIPFRKVYTGKLSEEQWKQYKDSVEKIKESPFYFDDTFGITIPEIRSKIRKLTEKDIKLIVIDQLEQIKGYDSLPTHLRFDKIAYEIKDLTQEFDIPIILNHQLNRNITDRKLKNPTPQLSDLNQAGEKPANQVWAITHSRADDNTILASKISLLKNRNGPRIEFPVLFLGSKMLFTNPAHQQEEMHHHEGEGTVKNSSSWINDLD